MGKRDVGHAREVREVIDVTCARYTDFPAFRFFMLLRTGEFSCEPDEQNA